jgi:predicted DNA-binding transcriptional regulator AlpA
MRNKRASITGEKYVNGTQLAKALGIGRSTLNRWIRAGKLPKPERSISGMLLFGRDARG